MKSISHEASDKFMVWMPMRSDDGAHVPEYEQFNLKTIYIYNDRIQIVSDLTSTPQYSRIFSFSQTSLECGSDQNKLCLASEYLSFHNSFTYHSSLLEYQQKNPLSLADQCLVYPVIDGTTDPSQDRSVVYICQDNTDQLLNFFTFKDKLSTFIDKYQLLITYDYYSAANGVITKQGLMKMNDDTNQFQSTTVRLFANKLKIYFPNSNLHKVLQEIQLKDIDEQLMTQPVLQAIDNKHLQSNWAEVFSPAQLAPCCLVIFLADLHHKKTKKFLCVDYEDPSQFDYNDCGNKVNSWARYINGQVKRRILIDKHYKIKNIGVFECKKNKDSDLHVRRLKALGEYHDRMCDVLRKYDAKWSQQVCDVLKSNDLVLEINKLAHKDTDIITSLINCVKKGHVDVGLKQLVFA